MMFLSVEDDDAKDNLFIYMRNTQKCEKSRSMETTEMEISLYITENIKNEFVNELQLNRSINNPFDFERFLNQINDSIPPEILIEDKVQTLRNNIHIVRKLGILDEANKTVLIGTRHLGKHKPRDKTLRKLYLYTGGAPGDIATLIKLLKDHNMTVAWTTKDKKNRAIEINQLINDIRPK